MNNSDREVIAWLKDGNYRKNILKLLNENPMLSSEIAVQLRIHRSSTSRLLKKLKERGFVDKISSGSRTVEYLLTQKGKKFLNLLKS